MGKIVGEFINRFDGGIVTDPRNKDTRYSRMVKNFDIHTYPYKMIPFKGSESGDANASTRTKRNFLIAPLGTSISTPVLYAMGRQSATDKAEVQYKNLTTGASNDLDDSSWADPTNNQSSGTVSAQSYAVFVYYARTNLIYMVATGKIMGFDVRTGGSQGVWDDDILTTDSAGFALSYTNIAQGLVHSKDDILYLPYDNKILKNNNKTWTQAALTLPTHLKITSICEYGNYIAIAGAPLTGYGKSVVYLWDRDASLTTLSENIDWGEGSIFILEEIDGYLVGISNVGTNSATTGPTFNQRIVFRYYVGGKAKIFKEIVSEESTAQLSVQIPKQKQNNYLYFFLAMTFPNGALHEGLWKLGRTEDGLWSLSLDRTPNNDTATTSGTLLGFIKVGDFVFIGYTDGGVHAISKTIEIAGTSEYTATTSIYESVILNDKDSSIKKKLRGVTVFTEPLPTAGQVVLKYQIDENIDTTTFVTVFTNTTDDSLSYSAVNIESTGVELPEYKEILFRIESTGGAIITGLKYKSEVIDKDIY